MNEENIISLNLTINQINIVLAGLGKLPLEAGIQTFELIHKQVNEQIKNTQQNLVNDTETE